MRLFSYCFLAAVLWLACSMPTTLRAAVTNYVTTTADSGPGSLRQSIIDANSAGRGTILFSNAIGRIGLSEALPPLIASVTIRGPGTNLLVLDGARRGRVFTVQSGSTSVMSGLTITGGFVVSNSGGAIRNDGNLTIVRCRIVANEASGGCGGGIFSSGNLSISSSVIESNRAVGVNALTFPSDQAFLSAYGGALCITNATLLVASSSFRYNFSRGGVGSFFPDRSGPAGGGAIAASNSTIWIFGSVFDGNFTLGGPGPNTYISSPPGNGAPAFGGGMYCISGDLTIGGCTFTNNRAAGGGGGVGRQGTGGSGASACGGGIAVSSTRPVRLWSSLMSANGSSAGSGFGTGSTGGGDGGAIYAPGGLLEASDCQVSHNYASGSIVRGGAFRVDVADLYRTTFYSNIASGVDVDGGAIEGSTIRLSNCTLSGNRANTVGGISRGGALWAFATLTNCTVANNFAARGGGIYGLGLTALNSVIANNGATEAPDIFGPVSSQGFNLITMTNGAYGFAETDLLGVDPRLGPLQHNGGTVLTHALLAGSPAIDAGTNSGLAYDARGQPRTIDNPAVANAVGGDGTDIGALELNHILTGTEVRRAGTDMLVKFTTVSDKTYGVEYRPEVDEGPWMVLPGIVAGTGGIATYTDTNAATQPRRFYRLFERTP